MSTRCSSCAADIFWAITVPRDGTAGRPIPLDLAPAPVTEQGVLFVVPTPPHRNWAYGLRTLAERIAKQQPCSYDRAVEIVRTRYSAYRAHHATCPSAEQHRTSR